jgi:hypothetical protein
MKRVTGLARVQDMRQNARSFMYDPKNGVIHIEFSLGASVLAHTLFCVRILDGFLGYDQLVLSTVFASQIQI